MASRRQVRLGSYCRATRRTGAKTQLLPLPSSESSIDGGMVFLKDFEVDTVTDVGCWCPPAAGSIADDPSTCSAAGDDMVAGAVGRSGYR